MGKNKNTVHLREVWLEMKNNLKTIVKEVKHPIKKCLLNAFSESGLVPALKELTAQWRDRKQIFELVVVC